MRDFKNSLEKAGYDVEAAYIYQHEREQAELRKKREHLTLMKGGADAKSPPFGSSRRLDAKKAA